MAVIRDGVVVEKNAGWNAFAEPGVTWSLLEDESTVFPTLEEAVESFSGDTRETWHHLVRTRDGFRVRLRVEPFEAMHLGTVVSESVEGEALHAARNDLAAATLRLRLLCDDAASPEATLRHAETVAELLRKVAASLSR